MKMYKVRFTMPGVNMVCMFACEAESYEDAERQFLDAYPDDTILVNIEEIERAPLH